MQWSQTEHSAAAGQSKTGARTDAIATKVHASAAFVRRNAETAATKRTVDEDQAQHSQHEREQRQRTSFIFEHATIQASGDARSGWALQKKAVFTAEKNISG
jgi:hypothetical protein